MDFATMKIKQATTGIKLAIMDFVDNNNKEYLFKYQLY